MDRRTKEYQELVKITPSTQELLSEEIDGEIYLYKHSSQCKVCNTSDDLKNIIDSLLLFPKSYKEVLLAIQPLQDKLGIEGSERINYENIRNHQKRHLPFEKQVVRDIVERRAKEKNLSILDTSDRLLTAEAFYEVIVAKGWEDLASGYNRPTLTQTMAAMEMLQKLEQQGQEDYRPEELINQLDMILMAIREVLPVDMKEKLFQRIEEYQNAEAKNKKPSAKALQAGDDEDYIDEDLEEDF
jgi:hypothetical protein